ncbi:MAG: serine protease, partial [Bacteroidetes bacterium]|nr:serine protease [Bacteroidota bacterium]
MIKYTSTLLAFLCLFLINSPQLLAQQKNSSVFFIETFNGQGSRLKAGTGFFIDDQGRAIVHASLLEGAETARLKTVDSTTHMLQRIEAADPYTGLVRFTIDNNQTGRFKPLLASSDAMPKQANWLAAPEPRAVSSGSATITTTEVADLGSVFLLNAPAQAESGSPLLASNGELVGVIIRLEE